MQLLLKELKMRQETQKREEEEAERQRKLKEEREKKKREDSAVQIQKRVKMVLAMRKHQPRLSNQYNSNVSCRILNERVEELRIEQKSAL